MARGMSLHIGLNKVDAGHYLGWSGPLTACEFDAEDMASLAKEQGFEPALLKTEAATREAVKDGIRKAAEGLENGDFFLLTYSGHGGQVADYNRDEPDNKDETWCLYDGQLIDDELLALWPEFQAGTRILVLSDSCHSGSVIRVAPFESEPAARIVRVVAEAISNQGFNFRYMPQEAAARTYRAHKKFYDGLQKDLPKTEKLLPKIKATVRLISGCQDNQYSLDGEFNGLFTGTLLRVWDSGQFDGAYSDFHRDILRLMPATQSPNHMLLGKANPVYDAQKPFQIDKPSKK